MHWIRHALIDLAVTGVILVATLGGYTWAAWIVWIYTPLMLLLKLGAVAGNVGGGSGNVPEWVYHILFGINLLALLYAGWYWVAAGWAVIWLLSVYQASRAKPKASPKAKR